MTDRYAVTPVHRLLALTLFGLLAIAGTVHAQAWNETGDAGSLVATAQVTTGSGPLQTIYGALDSPTDVDLYCIHLTSVPPANQPLAMLQCVVDSGPDVWLFDAAGNGVFLNESCAFGAKTLLAPGYGLAPGTYYLGVSYTGMSAQSPGGAIWLTPMPGQRTPDGPGAPGPLTGWAGAGYVQPLNPYQVNLSFMTYCGGAVPTLRPSWGSLKSHYR